MKALIFGRAEGKYKGVGNKITSNREMWIVDRQEHRSREIKKEEKISKEVWRMRYNKIENLENKCCKLSNHLKILQINGYLGRWIEAKDIERVWDIYYIRRLDFVECTGSPMGGEGTPFFAIYFTFFPV